MTEKKTAEPDPMAPAGENTVRPRRVWKKILLCLVILLVLGAGVGAAAFQGWVAIPYLTPHQEKQKKEVTAEIGPTLRIPGLSINLKGDAGRHFLKASLVLEIGKPQLVEEVKARTSVITDQAILILCEKTHADLKQSDCKEALKQDILAKANGVLGGPKIKRVFWDEFLFQ